MALERVDAHAHDFHSSLDVVGIGIAKLAKLPESAGGPVEQIEEGHQRSLTHELPESEFGAIARGKPEIGDRAIDQCLKRMSDHIAIMVVCAEARQIRDDSRDGLTLFGAPDSLPRTSSSHVWSG
jgi:hypothetical protein